VAAAFLPQKSSTDQVLRHLNDNPTDNRVENLAWGTYSDNLNDAIRNGRSHPKGESHCRAKLTEDNVREIRRLYATGEFTLKELAMRFGVHFSGIAKIVTRSTWKHVV
jgi:16S rRNA U516 pseudouridylate synthase RsuA-like enzyme